MRVSSPAPVVWLAASVLAMSSPAPPSAQTLGGAQLEEAWRLGRTRRPAELDDFTRPYFIARGGPGQPTVEVITEFRRAVLLTRQQADFGSYSWTPTDLARAMTKHAGLTTVRAEVWLPLVHVYVGTPTYRLDLYDAANRTVMPVEEKRDPIYTPSITGEGSAMTGVTLESIYRAEALRQAGCCLLILVDPNGQTVVKKEVDLAGLR